VNVCAEQIALGTALSAGHTTFVAGAAVIMPDDGGAPVVTSPCGVCRELLGTWAPEMTVLVDERGTVIKTYVEDLLPAPWLWPIEHTPVLPDQPSNSEQEHR
jgi:cytidine deaminase